MKLRKFQLYKPQIGRSLVGNTINFITLLFFAAIMVLPMAFSISNAFKPLDELFIFPPRFFVRNPTLENFANLSSLFIDSIVPFSRYISNTFFLTIVGTIGSILIASAAGYVLEKQEFTGKKVLFKLVVTALMFTSAVTSIPNYLIMSKLGWVDNYASILVPAFGSAFNVFLMKQFMVNVPQSILEAARVDGAGEQRIFWRIVMPMVKPAWLTLIIFSIQALWGTTGGSFIYSEQLKTLPYALSQIMSAGIVRTGASAATALLMMLVPITVFILTQSNILETMMSSGVKE